MRAGSARAASVRSIYVLLAAWLLAACSVSVSDEHFGQMAYQRLSAGNAQAGARHIDMDHAYNFRDVGGGLRTQDGRTFKSGLIYRSDKLSDLRKADFRKMDSLHIGAVYDLRTDHEIAKNPDVLPAQVRYVHAPTVRDDAGEIGKLRSDVLNGRLSVQQARDITTKFYKDAVTTNGDTLAGTIRRVVFSDTPVLYHCSAGKDRTGIVSALILSIAGVDRETIVNEFMLSNYYRRPRVEKTLRKAKAGKIIKRKLDLDAIEVLLSVDESFIRATFAAIDSAYGGIDPYITNQLHISPAQRADLVRKLTY